MIMFPPFEPDKSQFNTSAGDNLLNCLPRADGWGPMAQFIAVSDALPTPCLGAVFVRSYGGSFTVIAGTATDLYKLNTATSPYSWDSISKSAGAYAVPVNDKWTFTTFGDRLIAHNLGGATQFYDITAGGSFADLPGAPIAKYSCAAGDFLMFGYLDGEASSVQWSGINNSEDWVIGKNGSDKQLLPEGREIMAMIDNPRGAIVVQRKAMQFMQFSPNSGYTFTRSVGNSSRGSIAPHSIVEIGSGDFLYLSEDGFFRGVEGQPIGHARVDKWFYDNIDPNYLEDVRGMADPFEKIVWWRFKLINGTNFLLGYSWGHNRWCYSNVDVNEAAQLAAPGVAWDGLSALYASIDDVDVPFDSRLFKGGAPVFAGFTGDNKLAFAVGATLAATMETASVQLSRGGRSFVNGCRVIGDGSGTVSVGVAADHGGSFTYKTGVTKSPRSGIYHTRADGLLHRFKLDIPASENWDVISSIEPIFGGSGGL
ncbi:MAG: hypothetical protein COA78_17260 [Blastopirellula sp.]|nr:MAG: hypothetical protein COA78_17260 [Blastopirellula sp.]